MTLVCFKTRNATEKIISMLPVFQFNFFNFSFFSDNITPAKNENDCSALIGDNTKNETIDNTPQNTILCFLVNELLIIK